MRNMQTDVVIARLRNAFQIADAQRFEFALAEIEQILDASRAEQAGGDGPNMPMARMEDQTPEVQAQLRNLQAQHQQRPDGGECPCCGAPCVVGTQRVRPFPDCESFDWDEVETYTYAAPAPPAVGEGDAPAVPYGTMIEGEPWTPELEAIYHKTLPGVLAKVHGFGDASPIVNVLHHWMDMSSARIAATQVLQALANTAPPSREVGDALTHVDTPDCNHCYAIAMDEAMENWRASGSDELTLERWGLNWKGHDHAVCERMDDGYWTPWHIADELVRHLSAAPRQVVDWQQRCIDMGFKYWRAPDAHGVTCAPEQALDLLRELLGVEVDFVKQPAPGAVDEAMVLRACDAYDREQNSNDCAEYTAMFHAITAALTPDAIRPGG